MSAVAVYGFRRSLSRRFYDLHVAQHICDMHEEINRAVSCGDHWGAWRERFRGTVLVIQAVLLHFFTVHWLFTPFVAYATARLIGVEPMKAAQASLAAAVAQVVLRAFVPVPALENRPDAIHEDRNV
ncbi:MAG: hypothetical protein KDB14_30490 [Planctomycetales bacterium]|nr:hypothetical protein [Planctomycetales bacterium]